MLRHVASAEMLFTPGEGQQLQQSHKDALLCDCAWRAPEAQAYQGLHNGVPARNNECDWWRSKPREEANKQDCVVKSIGRLREGTMLVPGCLESSCKDDMSRLRKECLDCI